MKTRHLALILLAGVTISCVLWSCQGNSPKEAEEVDPVAMENKSKAAKVFYAIPSPNELSAMIKSSGVNYNKNILNAVSNQSKYTSILQIALNLGVYGADLSYTSTFDQTQEAMAYMAVCKKLADGLGITGAINENTVARMEKNLNNKDSLLKIVSDTYMETDIYLKNNDRAGVSALVIAGGWIEGLYISVNVAAQNANNQEIMKRIAEQKLVLDNLIGLLETNEGGDNAPDLMVDLKALKTIFDGIKATEPTSPAEVKTDNTAQKTTVGSNGVLTLTPEQYKTLSSKITEIRNKIIG